MGERRRVRGREEKQILKEDMNGRGRESEKEEMLKETWKDELG